MRKKTQTSLIVKKGVAGISNWVPFIPLHEIVSRELLTDQSTLFRISMTIWLIFNQYNVNQNDKYKRKKKGLAYLLQETKKYFPFCWLGICYNEDGKTIG